MREYLFQPVLAGPVSAFCVFLLSTSALAAVHVPFGIWVGTSGEQYIEHVRNFNVDMIHDHVWWIKFEPSDDDFRYEYHEERLSDIRDAGFRVSYVLKIGRSWATGDSDSLYSQRPSHVPVDLSEEWDPRFGYSESYYDFVNSFVQFCNIPERRINHIVIENEPHSPSWFAGSPSEYLRLLKTAYKAATEADPDIMIVNGGVSSTAMGAVLTCEMIHLHDLLGRYGEDQILNVANGYFRRHASDDCWHSYDQLVTGMTECERFSRAYDFLTFVLDNLRIEEMAGQPPAIDIFNFHFFEDYGYLDHLMKWIRYRLYSVNRYPEILIASDQTGCRVPRMMDEHDGDILDPSYESSTVFAFDLFKFLVDALYRDLEKLLQFQMIRNESYDFDKAHLGYLENGIVDWYPASEAYRTITTHIGEGYVPRYDEPLKVKGVRIYAFSRPDDPEFEPIFAVWTDSGTPVDLTFGVPKSYGKIRKVDYRGYYEDISIELDGHVREEFTSEPFLYILLQKPKLCN